MIGRTGAGVLPAALVRPMPARVEDQHHIIEIRDSSAQELPSPAARASSAGALPTSLGNAQTALRVGIPKGVARCISSGLGEISAATVSFGINSIAASGGASASAVLIPACIVVLGGSALAGRRAGQIAMDAEGRLDHNLKRAVALGTVLVPIVTALGAGLAGAAAMPAVRVLSGAIGQMLGAGLQETINETWRGALAESRHVDSDGRELSKEEAFQRRAADAAGWSVAADVAIAGVGEGVLYGMMTGHQRDYALVTESAASLGGYLGYVSDLKAGAVSAVIKGGYAVAGELGGAVAAWRDKQGGIKKVDGQGLSVWKQNWGDKKVAETAERIADGASSRIAVATRDSLLGAIAPNSDKVGLKIVAVAFAGAAEGRSYVLDRARMTRQRQAVAPPPEMRDYPPPPPGDE